MITIHPWEYDPNDQVGWDKNYSNEKKSLMLMSSLDDNYPDAGV